MKCLGGHLSATKHQLKMHYVFIFFPKKRVLIHFHPYELWTAATLLWGFNCTEAKFSSCQVLIMALPVCPSAETLNWGLIPLPVAAAQVKLRSHHAFLKEDGATSESWPSFSKHVIHKAGGKLLLHIWSCQLDFRGL